MSEKNCDGKGRFRSRTIAFRMSPEEAEQLDKLVKISGYTKQDYLIDRVLQRDIIVRGSPRIYKALKDTLGEVLFQLQLLNTVSDDNSELLELIAQINTTLRGFAAES